MKTTLSAKLLDTLQKGKAMLSNEALCRMKEYVGAQKTNDDSFVDKNGNPDLYYTLFGWMLACILGIPLDPKKTEAFLNAQDISRMDLIHYAAYMRCRHLQHWISGGKLRLYLNAFRKENIRHLHTFDKVPNDDSLSPYSQYIWLSLLQDSGHSPDEIRSLVSFPHCYCCPDGGYANYTATQTGTTNATAAALALSGELYGYQSDTDVSFLQRMQHAVGGFLATPVSLIPDLLSTATALFVLHCYGVKPLHTSHLFLEAHWLDDGGFAATVMEDSSDVEYTFYGLLTLGAL